MWPVVVYCLFYGHHDYISHSRIPGPAFFETAGVISADSASRSNCSLDAPVVCPVSVSAVLLPVGKGVEHWEEFGQCLCMDWFPGNKKCKVAAGFSNGVCV